MANNDEKRIRKSLKCYSDLTGKNNCIFDLLFTHSLQNNVVNIIVYLSDV